MLSFGCIQCSSCKIFCLQDIALIMISPSGRFTFFSGKKRIEDVLLQYLNLNDEEIELDQEDSEEKLVNDREGVISTLMRLRTEATNANQSPKDLSTLMEENMGLQHQIDKVKEQLRAFEPDLQKFTSLKEMESCEEHLCKTLDLIEQRKKILLSNHSSSYQETVESEKLMMENEGAMTSMHNNGTYQFQPQSSESWKDKEFIYPENLMNQMLGEGKGKEVAITNGVPLPISSSYGLSDAPLQVNINPDNLQQYIKNYGSDKVRMEAPVPQQQSENISSSFGNFSGLKSNNCYLGYPTSLSSSNLVDMTTFDLGLPKNQLMQGFDEANGMEKGKEINNGENGDALPLVHYSPSES